MKGKNSGKTVVLDEDGKRSESRHQEYPSTEIVQNPVKEPALAPPLVVERRFRQTDLPAHFIERRKHPRISTEQPPVPAPPRFEDYAPIIGKPELDEIRFLARHLRGKT